MAVPYEALREVWWKKLDTLRTFNWKKINEQLVSLAHIIKKETPEARVSLCFQK
jgi:hypothetical protein